MGLIGVLIWVIGLLTYLPSPHDAPSTGSRTTLKGKGFHIQAAGRGCEGYDVQL